MASKRIKLAKEKYVWTLKGSTVWTSQWGSINFDTLDIGMAERMIKEGCKFLVTAPTKKAPPAS